MKEDSMNAPPTALGPSLGVLRPSAHSARNTSTEKRGAFKANSLCSSGIKVTSPADDDYDREDVCFLDTAFIIVPLFFCPFTFFFSAARYLRGRGRPLRSQLAASPDREGKRGARKQERNFLGEAESAERSFSNLKWKLMLDCAR